MRHRHRRRRRRRRRRILIGGMVIAGVGYGAYKLTQSQAQQVEQASGKKLEDMDETEMENTMNELGIEAQEPTEEEMAQLDAQGGSSSSATAAPTASPAAAPAASASDPSYLDELERLAQLHEEGVITDEEFEAKKKELLGL